MPLIPDPSLALCLTPVKPVTVCKICGQPAALHGVVDFNKSCEVVNGVYPPLSGIPVWYHRCTNCEFLFSEQFDHWTAEMFRQHIYNDFYAKADPEQDGTRARRESGALIALARQFGARRILDFGGGDGTLARILNENGFDARSWDPMRADAPPDGEFELVTAYEVIEHTPTPLRTCQLALSFLRAGGIFLFSTATVDGLKPQSCDHYYIAPRNGHISIHTRRSLALLFGRLGWSIQHFGASHHVARANRDP